MDLTVANYKKQGGSGGGGGGGGVSEVREYRKGNWTVEEAMVLIEAKKMDEERRMKRASHGGERGKPAELRWKWVEDYCWRRGCFRSQNQCNDKWDNLMRDFKKVREYEGRRAAAVDCNSYWRIEKNERREKNLPSNFSPEIYEALVELTERKSTQRFAASVLGEPSMPPHHHPLQQPPLTQTAPPPTHPPPTERPALAFSQAPLPTVDSDDTSDESSESPAAKRRKGEGTSGTASGTPVRLEEVGSAIAKSASIIAEAIQSCDEREERREREMMSLHERRLKIEESKAEINRRGINSLVDAVNKLADSIFALAHQHSSK